MPRRLPNKPDLQSFVRKGESFEFACRLLGFHRDFTAVTSFAVVTNSAFAAEVYLKALVLIEKDTTPYQTHDLAILFSDLDEKTQTIIRAGFEKEFLPQLQKDLRHPLLPDGIKVPESFDEALALSAGAFVDWRYAEISDQPLSYYMAALSDLARRRIYELRPELEGRARIPIIPKG